MFTLLSAGENTVVNMSAGLLEESVKLSESITNIGTAIGSIFLLIVLIYYIVSMMDGGKFQMKMLVPLLLFLLVSNFTWVAKPVLTFTTAITSSISEAFKTAKLDMLNPQMDDNYTTIHDYYVGERLTDDPTSEENKSGISEEQDDEPGVETESGIGSMKKSTFFDQLFKVLYRGSAISIITDFAVSSTKSVSENLTSERLSLVGILSQLMNWLCVAVSFCMQVFGIMMTSIIVAFGPITFAFAMWPGRASNIVSWFIRICQFSLYSPLCAFIDTFTTSSFLLLDSAESGLMGFLLVFALTLANLVGLTSVPTIASMIIEGAQGAVSLSQGMQMLSGAAMTSGSALMGATVGSNNGLRYFAAGMGQKGLLGFVREIGKEQVDASGNTTRAGIIGAVKNTAAQGQRSLNPWGNGQGPTQ